MYCDRFTDIFFKYGNTTHVWEHSSSLVMIMFFECLLCHYNMKLLLIGNVMLGLKYSIFYFSNFKNAELFLDVP